LKDNKQSLQRYSSPRDRAKTNYFSATFGHVFSATRSFCSNNYIIRITFDRLVQAVAGGLVASGAEPSECDPIIRIYRNVYLPFVLYFKSAEFVKS
jgi:hypothetical protein